MFHHIEMKAVLPIMAIALYIPVPVCTTDIERITVIGQRLPSDLWHRLRDFWEMFGNDPLAGTYPLDPAKVKQGTKSRKLVEGAKGEKLVKEVIKLVEDALGETNGFLLKVALVESRFGNDPDTVRKGYDGGIFQVDKIGFKDSQDVRSHPGLGRKFAAIKQAFGIDWSKVSWKDLRKPLYSAIAARLYLLNKPGRIPSSLQGQASYWKHHYNSGAGAGTVDKFKE